MQKRAVLMGAGHAILESFADLMRLTTNLLERSGLRANFKKRLTTSV